MDATGAHQKPPVGNWQLREPVATTALMRVAVGPLASVQMTSSGVSRRSGADHGMA